MMKACTLSKSGKRCKLMEHGPSHPRCEAKPLKRGQRRTCRLEKSSAKLQTPVSQHDTDMRRVFSIEELRILCKRLDIPSSGDRNELMKRMLSWKPDPPPPAIMNAIPSVPEFPAMTSELVSAIYYDAPVLGTRILLIGEYHSLSSQGDVSGYIEALRRALMHRGKCLDYYIEMRNPDIRKAKEVDIPVMIGGNNKTKKNPSGLRIARQKVYKNIPYIRAHLSDGRGMVKYEETDDAPAGHYMFPDYGMPLQHWFLRKMKDIRFRLLVGPQSPSTDRDINMLHSVLINVNYTRYTADELLALYYGVGPSSTKSGKPNTTLLARYRRQYDDIKTAFAMVIDDFHKSSESRPTPKSGHVWSHDFAFIISPSYLAILRSRGRKTLKKFVERRLCSNEVLYQAMKSAVVWARRRDYPNLKNKQMFDFRCIEAFADIYTFLRMFRIFDTDVNSPCPHGVQKHIVYHAHVGHSLTITLLIRMVFGVRPTQMFGQTDDLRKYMQTIEQAAKSPGTVVSGYRMQSDIKGLTITPGTVFFA